VRCFFPDFEKKLWRPIFLVDFVAGFDLAVKTIFSFFFYRQNRGKLGALACLALRVLPLSCFTATWKEGKEKEIRFVVAFYVK
jgi:hypothetical protein